MSYGFVFNIILGIQDEGFQGIIFCGIEQYGVIFFEDIIGRIYIVE